MVHIFVKPISVLNKIFIVLNTKGAYCERVDESEGTVDVRVVTMVLSDEWTVEKVRKVQQEDSDICPLHKSKEDNRPRRGWEDVSPGSPTLKAMWAKWKSLRV